MSVNYQVSLTSAWLFEYTGGGCLAEVKDSVFPLSHREGAFTVAALHQWGHTEQPEQDTRCVTTAEDWVTEVIHANSPGGPLPCVSLRIIALCLLIAVPAKCRARTGRRGVWRELV